MKFQARLIGQRWWLCLLFCLLLCTFSVAAQTAISSPSFPLSCSLTQISPAQRSLHVRCTLADPPTGKLRIHLTDQFAGVAALSERVFGFKVRDANGDALPLELLGNGVSRVTLNAAAKQLSLGYELRLARALDPAQYALVSSLGPDAGVLLLADVLPRVCVGDADCDASNAVRVRITPPDGWQLATSEKEQGAEYVIADPARAVFLLGRLRTKTVSVGGLQLRVALTGSWRFRDDAVFALAEAIVREQAALMGGTETGEVLFALAPYPQPLTGLRSSAITPGRTVVLLLNEHQNDAQTWAQFRFHLAHELFHVYLPNAFRIRENFDWFWEGFTRYMALVTLVRLRVLGVREYLDALNAEYDAYAFNPLRAQLSLVAASPEKFANAASYDLVYRKGMLVAALYDLELRWQSRGQRNIADVMQRLYREYGRTGKDIGNQEVLTVLAAEGDFARLLRDDITGTTEIDLAARVKPYGLVVESSAPLRGRTRLAVKEKLSDRQRQLLVQFLGSL